VEQQNEGDLIRTYKWWFDSKKWEQPSDTGCTDFDAQPIQGKRLEKSDIFATNTMGHSRGDANMDVMGHGKYKWNTKWSWEEQRAYDAH
jgi:hypothetical protein